MTPDPLVAVTVVRTGGIAGMRRSWSVEAVEAEDAERWVLLVDACPWDEHAADGDAGPPGDARRSGRDRSPAGAPGPSPADGHAARRVGRSLPPDRFSYDIRARQRRDEALVDRHVVLAESRLTGPWRTLADEVRQRAATPAG